MKFIIGLLFLFLIGFAVYQVISFIDASRSAKRRKNKKVERSCRDDSADEQDEKSDI